jgi:hypothetical protein
MAQRTEIPFGDARLPSRFWAKVDVGGNGCWLWTAGKLRGYGNYSHEGRTAKAHRVAYQALVAPVPAGLALDHLCRNPSCVNPAHLEPVTWQTNIHRGELAALTTMDDAREIRRRIRAGETVKVMAAAYGITARNVWRIMDDRTYREDSSAPVTPYWPDRSCEVCGTSINHLRVDARYCGRQHRQAAANVRKPNRG